ncbi:MAG TPA: 16S rRNA (cytidine(1402)-2'-O)-methyltransferase [Spirochaetota bacterium]|nr:16S rRNA (cytidine(1402)-2'-O)-methyltransferase [Spirochaetota bacterium]HPR39310.1 16S rRNA (cytidine(1402)-2'-O)-methyltransferase [Spirochaetota bacterium]HRX48595.1 16S rRNA (cytidine(1402)-2'-O)-methyltransferase [Spirochaetota bacterium]
MTTSALYIIAAPIGNPDDMTIRAVNMLRDTIDIIYCEDTRQTGRILSHFGISKPLRSLHMHSDDRKIRELIAEIESGKNIGYMTDAGTPGLSDPGSKIVAIARSEGIEVIPLPGVSALTTLVSVSGFPDKSVLFGGFLSKKPGRRVNELKRMREHEGILVIYESPHRIRKTLTDIKEVFPHREVVIGREMTKKFEEYIRLNAGEMDEVLEKLTEKGEFAIAILNKELKFSSDEED